MDTIPKKSKEKITIVTGDVTQVDLPDKNRSGLIQIQNVLQKIDGIKFIYLSEKDVVRHKLVRDIIIAYDKYDDKKKKEDLFESKNKKEDNSEKNI